MKKKYVIGIISLIIMLTANPVTVRAKNVEIIAINDDWGAYAANGKKTCYISTTPKDSEPKNVNRGDIYFMVGHHGENNHGQVSTIVGYPLKEGSYVTATIDNKISFQMFAVKNAAWLENQQEDKKMIAAMKKGNQMKVVGYSWRNTRTTDIYSLKGFSKSMRQIDAKCAVK